MNKILSVCFWASCWEGRNIYHPTLDPPGAAPSHPTAVTFELVHICGWWGHPSAFFGTPAISVALPATNAKRILAPVLGAQSESAEWAGALHMSPGTRWDKMCPKLLVP